MAWRIIGIENPASLSLKNGQLAIRQEQEVTVPIEDIDSLILDGYGIVATANVLVELACRGTTVVICDEKHLPASILLPYSQHSRQAKVSRLQLAMKQPLKKQLWQKVITQKILNQADVLGYFQHDNTVLIDYATGVRSGDITNRESLAARLYFSDLLEDATRRKPMWHNAALNYGYAIIRGHIARHIAARGLIASQGIFHKSELNSYNLADDIIETFRPAVDLYVLSRVAPFHIGDPDAFLTKEDRRLLIDVLNQYVIINNKKFPMRVAIERCIESFVVAVEVGSQDELILPSILKS